jgi:hypothetical protein
VASEPVTVAWNPAELERFFREPDGELGRGLFEAIGAGVAERARRKALRRTGRMASAITHQVGADEAGLFVDVISPVTDPRTGFPYARAHEGPHPRDRRPHRSLRPALDEAPAVIEGL